MVAQKSSRPFLEKIHNFFDENNLSERHRSGVVQATFRHRSGVVQKTVQAGSTQRNISPLYFVTGHNHTRFAKSEDREASYARSTRHEQYAKSHPLYREMSMSEVSHVYFVFAAGVAQSERPLGIIQIGWVGLSVHTYKFTRPFSKHSLKGFAHL